MSGAPGGAPPSDTRSSPRFDGPAIRGGLLVGGASRRMGEPKQLLVHAGSTLAERAADALGAHCDEVVLLGDGEVPAALGHLLRLADAPLPDGGETTPGGPLAGLLAAGRHRPPSAWIFTPCDLPLVAAGAVGWLLGERRPERSAVLVRPRPDLPVDPLFALYEPPAFALLERLAAAGERAPRAIERQPGVAVVTPPEPLAACWRGVNSPAELAALPGSPPAPR